MFMCFLQLCKVAIGFAVFTSLLCYVLRKTHQVYYLHVPENSQILPIPVSPWGEPVSLSQLSKADAQMLCSCLHFFLLQEQTNCHLSYIFLQAIPCKQPCPVSPCVLAAIIICPCVCTITVWWLPSQLCGPSLHLGQRTLN